MFFIQKQSKKKPEFRHCIPIRLANSQPNQRFYQRGFREELA